MRIAFVYDIPYPWHRGGIEHILNIEARELAKKHEVHFFTMKWPGMRSEFRHQGVRYHAFGEITEEKAYRHGRRSIREAVMFSLYLRRLFDYDFDVVISNAFPVLHLPLVRAYCKAINAKLILKVDEVWDRKYWISYLGRGLGDGANVYANTFIRSRSARYVANSVETAGKLEKIGVDKERISVFAPILEDREMDFVRKEVRSKKRRIIFSGRLIKEKRVDKWLRVVRKVVEKDRRVSAVLIGEGVERKNIAGMIRSMGLEDSVTMMPFFKKKEDLYRELAASAVLLHMGEREGLSIIALECLALGTPVVLPAYSPIPEEVRKMCIVEKEERIPAKILEVINGGGTAIANRGNLKMFSASNVVAFYDSLFKL